MTFTDAVIQILAGVAGTLGFGILFNVRGRKLLCGCLGAFISWSLYLIFSLFIPSEILVYLLVSISTSIYSEIMAVVLKTPTTTFLIISLIPLIPGGSLYYALSHAFEGDLVQFLTRALYTLQLASALSAGIILVISLTRTVKNLRRRVKKSTQNLGSNT